MATKGTDAEARDNGWTHRHKKTGWLCNVMDMKSNSTGTKVSCFCDFGLGHFFEWVPEEELESIPEVSDV